MLLTGPNQKPFSSWISLLLQRVYGTIHKQTASKSLWYKEKQVQLRWKEIYNKYKKSSATSVITIVAL